MDATLRPRDLDRDAEPIAELLARDPARRAISHTAPTAGVLKPGALDVAQ